MKPSVILVTGAATAIGIGIADLLAPSRPTPA
jgi:NAD(P)-dependent dehydrogenase (short-subunit alcohol dehydrogenase family)